MSKSSKRSRTGPGPVPDRWLHCPRKATDLIVGKFLAFKTPLSESFDEQVPLECRFPPSMLFETCKKKKIQLGLWIDLTYTSRFYDKESVEAYGCKYIKLQCRGHGQTPSEEQKNTFVHLVHNFIANNPLQCIAVHCTHGFNRTGFLIVSYLIERMDMGIEIALEMFAKVRPPGIYKHDYLEELYRRYDDVDDTPPPPERPDWCFEEDNSSSNYDNSSECSTSSTQDSDWSPKRKVPKQRVTKQPIFMQGVPGVSPFIEQPKAFQLQRKVHAMCEWKSNKGFPGSQPVSMDTHNIELLHQKPYRVSWKADGTRYMMLIDGDNEIYFFDRDHSIFKVDNLRFPHRKDFNKHLKDTLIDGEMVIDKVNGESIPRYLAYDIIRFEGQPVAKMEFYPTRLHCIQNEIINPRIGAMEAGIINRAEEPFSVRKKEFWHITQTANLLGEKFAKALSHEPDGLIFQPSKEPYIAGRCDEVLKWKPLDLNSVDFRLRIVKEGGVGIVSRKVGHLYVLHLDKPFATIKYNKELKELDNKIIECKYEDNQWKFMRERTDKSLPNSYNTAKAVCGSIRDPVTKERLIDYIDKHRFNDDTEVMPPPPPAKKRKR